MEHIHQVRFKAGLQAEDFLHAVCAKTGKDVCYWTEHSHTVTRGKTFNTELEGLNNNLTDGEAALAEGTFSNFSAFTFKSLTATGAEDKKNGWSERAPCPTRHWPWRLTYDQSMGRGSDHDYPDQNRIRTTD